jgi:hypothetical protein
VSNNVTQAEAEEELKSSSAMLQTALPDGRSDALKGRKVASPSPECLALYRAYPRHVAPKDAYRAIEKALKETPFEELLASVERFAAKMKRDGEEEKFIPYPATWFNGGRYLDEEKKRSAFPAGMAFANGERQ